MEISIIVIGDELLIGQVTDTNSGDIARMIAPAGWTVKQVTTVHDNAADIRKAIESAMSETPVVITTGGLGPTKDDITKETLCSIFGGGLHLDEDVLHHVEDVFCRRGLQMNRLTRSQAMVPDSCTVIPNELGTAPVMWFERNNKVLVAMPGVPFETHHAFSSEVLPRLLKKYSQRTAIFHSNFVVAGISESALAELLTTFEENLPAGFHLAYLPQGGYIKLRLDAIGQNTEQLRTETSRQNQLLRDIAGKYIIAEDDFTPEELIMTLLKELHFTMASAESCTGGNIAHRMTELPGVSEVFMGGVVSYSNQAKMQLLGVSEETLKQHGAVSEQTVAEMARGAMKAFGTNAAVATSGIAGPGGAVAGKPVGTVCIAIAVGPTTRTMTEHFPGSRERVIERASTKALLSLATLLTAPDSTPS